MKTVKSFNKATGKTYVYEILENKWDPVKKRGVPTRRCIGHLDPVTGELVPNGRKGPRKKESSIDESASLPSKRNCSADSANYKEMCDSLLEQILQKDTEIRELKRGIHELQKLFSACSEKLETLTAPITKDSSDLESAEYD